MYLFAFINFDSDFYIEVQKRPKTCVNCVLKFQFFLLNLSSEVLAGVRVNKSKYPYKNICEENYIKDGGGGCGWGGSSVVVVVGGGGGGGGGGSWVLVVA